jgi:hypothetical protein
MLCSGAAKLNRNWGRIMEKRAATWAPSIHIALFEAWRLRRLALALRQRDAVYSGKTSERNSRHDRPDEF